MKKINDDYSSRVDEQLEVDACARLLDRSWNFSHANFQGDGFKSPSQCLVETVFQECAKVARDQYCGKDAQRQVDKFYRARGNNLKIAGGGAGIELFDGLCVMLDRIRQSDVLKPAAGLKERAVEAATAALAAKFPDIELTAPVGYHEFMSQFRRNPDSVSDLATANLKELTKGFEGTESLGFDNLPDGVSLYTTAYQEGMGHAPYQTLIASLVEQGLTVAMVNNTVELVRELHSLNIGQNFLDREVDSKPVRLEALHEKTQAAPAANRAMLPQLVRNYRGRSSSELSM